MALMKRSTAQYPIGVDWNLKPSESLNGGLCAFVQAAWGGAVMWSLQGLTTYL